jgi:hypothetical protein
MTHIGGIVTLKNFSLAIAFIVAVGAVMASTASATMSSEGQWYIGETFPGTALPEGTSKTMACENESPRFILTGTVGEALIPTKIAATGMECVGASIKNEGSHGVFSGKLQFTGVTVVEPSGCTVENGTVTTEALKAQLYMDSGSSTLAFAKFEPAAGATGRFAVVKIQGCAIAGSKTVRGSMFGEATNPTSTFAAKQPLEFSSTVDTTAESALILAGNEAHISGQAADYLSSGESFMAHTSSAAQPPINAAGEWYTGSTATTLTEGAARSVRCSVSGSTNLLLTVSFAGVPVKLEATGTECIGITIKNEGGNGYAFGRLKFTGVTVKEPASCTVEGGFIETTELKAKLYSGPPAATLAFVKFEPAILGGNYATVRINSCAIAGNYVVRGSALGEGSNPRGVTATTQQLIFSSGIDATTGAGLSFGGNEAHLSGRINNSLSMGELFTVR